MDTCIELIEKMRARFSDDLVRYKELFPKNRPKNALTDTIFVLRVIHRFPTFLDRHPDLPSSFREEIRILMTESIIARFQRFKEQATPENPNDAESVIAGINMLAELVNEEIELDITYYKEPFNTEIDIVRLNAELQLKYFALVLEDGADIIGADAAVASASHFVFELYRNVRVMAERYAKSFPGYYFNNQFK